MEDKKERIRLSATFNRTIQENNHGGNEYESFSPSVTISMGVEEDLSPKEMKEKAEALYMVARLSGEECIEQRKEELRGNRGQESFLKDAHKANAKLEAEAEMKGEEFPKDFPPEKINPPFSGKEDDN